MVTETTEPSEADVLSALRTLAGTGTDLDTKPAEPVVEDGKVENAETAPTTDVPAEVGEAPEAVVGQVDDVDSLKARVKQTEESFERYKQKASSSLEWSRNLALKTATERENLKGILRKIKEKGEVSAEEIDAVLNAQQAQIPTTSGAPAAQDNGFVESEALRFTTDYNIPDAEQERFDQWIRAEASANGIRPHEVADGDPYRTFQNLYLRFTREGAPMRADSPEMVKAVQNVARTQRAAARAAGPPSNRSAASPPPDTGIDLSDLIKKDPDKAVESGLIDRLFKEVNATGF